MFGVSDPARFDNLTSGFRNVVVIAGVIVGGVWTLWTFNALGVRARADAELFEQATVDIEVTAVQEVVDDSGLYIVAEATITNTGNRNTYLDYEALPSWAVTRVDHDDTGYGWPEDWMEYRAFDAAYRVLRRTETTSHPLYLKVPEPGLYHVLFQVPLSEQELSIHNETAAEVGAPQEEEGIVWAGSAYVVVRALDVVRELRADSNR